MSVMAEAFRWWNSNVEKLPANKKPPNCSVPEATTSVFAKILPILYFNVKPAKTDTEYWKNLRNFIALFLYNQNVPDPLKDFQNFLIFLYEKKNLLYPKELSDCTDFFVRLSLTFGQNSIIYLAPKYIGDPFLYINALLRLKDDHHPFWNKILTGTYEMDTLFNLYSSLHTPCGKTNNSVSSLYSAKNKAYSEMWSFRLAVAELVFDLTLASLSGNPNSEQYLQLFNENTLEIIKEAPGDVALSLARLYVQLTKRVMMTCNEYELATYAFELLTAVSKKEHVYDYLLRFFLTVNPRILRGFKMLKVVTAVGLRSTHDIQTLCDLSEVADPAPTIACLGFNMLQSKVWHRSCAAAILKIARNNDSNSDVRDWLSRFIKLLFMFVSLTVFRGKYERRAAMVCETLSKVMREGLPWMKKLIITSSASTWATGSTPSYFGKFFPFSQETDLNFAEEFNMVLMMDIDLKYFPFEGNTLKLISTSPNKPRLGRLQRVPKTLSGKMPKSKKTKKVKKKSNTKAGKTLTGGKIAKKRVPKTLA